MTVTVSRKIDRYTTERVTYDLATLSGRQAYRRDQGESITLNGKCFRPERKRSNKR